ncbi:hypothetical protein SDC9_105352 [bioreactor metagenome]|uniref:Uncharacterized protein n=1 Tax=bioreactor metagenome TaxID=1076179 RepID=A0A645B1T0_9ZZZZ
MAEHFLLESPFPLKVDSFRLPKIAVRTTEHQSGGVVVLNQIHPHLLAFLVTDIGDGKGGIADLALLTDRKRVHDDTGRVREIHRAETQLVGHPCGEACKHISLHPTAQAITEGTDNLVILRIPAEQKHISANLLTVLVYLGIIHIDEDIVHDSSLVNPSL